MKKRFAFLFILTAILAVSAPDSVNAQKRDYMTEAEVEIVRNNQEIDTRIAVLTRMIDRRFLAMGIDTAGPKLPKRSDDDWGPEPKGTKPELLTDIRQLLEKAIDDVDSLPGRLPERMKNQKGEDIFGKAVRSLVASANRWLPHLKKENAAAQTAQDEKLYGITAASIEFCEQIIEAAGKVK